MSSKQAQNQQIANTILHQLGGKKFIVMTGSKNFIAGNNSLTMQLAKNSSKANYLRITLTAMDDYKMEFITICGINEKENIVRNGVYDDNLQSIFTEVTGLVTYL